MTPSLMTPSITAPTSIVANGHPACRFATGGIAVTGLRDGRLDLPAGYFPQALAQGLVPSGGTVPVGANAWLIRTGARTVLVDAGSGDALAARFPETGRLVAALAAHGTDPGEVTDIVLTHMHGDHVGGLVRGGENVFANAEIHVGEEEWRFWTDPATLAAAPAERAGAVRLVQAVAAIIAPRIRRHTGEADLGGGLRLVPAPGHTPGHRIVHLSSGGAQAMILGDAIVSQALQFARPDLHYALDTDPGLAAATRHKLFRRLAADRIPFAATHLHSPAPGLLSVSGSGYRFEPDA